MVALSTDTEVHPPKIPLIRGRVELDVVNGIPDEYLQINGSYEMAAEQRVEWEAEVRSRYGGMVRVVVTVDLGEAHRRRDHPAHRGRGAGPTAGGTPEDGLRAVERGVPEGRSGGQPCRGR